MATKFLFLHSKPSVHCSKKRLVKFHQNEKNQISFSKHDRSTVEQNQLRSPGFLKKVLKYLHTLHWGEWRFDLEKMFGFVLLKKGNLRSLRDPRTTSQ